MTKYVPEDPATTTEAFTNFVQSFLDGKLTPQEDKTIEDGEEGEEEGEGEGDDDNGELPPEPDTDEELPEEKAGEQDAPPKEEL